MDSYALYLYLNLKIGFSLGFFPSSKVPNKTLKLNFKHISQRVIYTAFLTIGIFALGIYISLTRLSNFSKFSATISEFASFFQFFGVLFIFQIATITQTCCEMVIIFDTCQQMEQERRLNFTCQGRQGPNNLFLYSVFINVFLTIRGILRLFEDSGYYNVLCEVFTGKVCTSDRPCVIAAVIALDTFITCRRSLSVLFILNIFILLAKRIAIEFQYLCSEFEAHLESSSANESREPTAIQNVENQRGLNFKALFINFEALNRATDYYNSACATFMFLLILHYGY